MSGTLSDFEAELDSKYGLGAGTLESQEQVESGGNEDAYNASSGAEGPFQILPSTAANPGYGVTPISDPYDPEQSATFAAQYDSAMASQTGSVGGGLAAYNEGLGNYQTQGTSGASPAYQSLIASLGMGSATGATASAPSGSGGSSGGGGSGWQTLGEVESATNPLGSSSPIGSILGGVLGGSGGSSSGSSGPTEQVGTFISGWVIRVIVAVGGLIAVAVALSMFKQTAPIVTAVTTPIKNAAKGAALAAAA
jgi:hypothetical protein